MVNARISFRFARISPPPEFYGLMNGERNLKEVNYDEYHLAIINLRAIKVIKGKTSADGKTLDQVWAELSGIKNLPENSG
ncbi:hypothetical protein CEXT_140961 [Caerostris extrusa]|uniref:Uncharacterized protein n=1 Tax=Caerostris extrusa TaxID=172846 RepID=A0AAV4QIK8_CAEEX|nr:hypothetical protein CEXT_140961 [Caerostris extrusa]